MAEVKQYTLSVTGTEIEFIQAFIDMFCSLGSNITCEDTNGDPTTAALQYADLTSASTATFIFNMGNNIKLRFWRNADNSQTVARYRFSINGSSDSFYIDSMYSAQAILTVTTRAFFITTVKSDNFFAIWVAGYSQTSIPSNIPCIMRILNNNENYVMINPKTGNTALRNTFTSNNSVSVNYKQLFRYTTSAGNIDYLDHTVFASGSTKVFDFPEIYSCSNLTFGTSISLPNGRNFWAIDTNAMVEVDEE